MGNVFLTTKCLRIATILVSCSSRAKIGSYSKKTVTSPSFSTVALVLKKSQWIRLSNGYHFFFFSNYSITSRECYGYDSVEYRFPNFPVHAILSPVANIGKRSGRTHKNLKETPFLPRSHHLVASRNNQTLTWKWHTRKFNIGSTRSTREKLGRWTRRIIWERRELEIIRINHD